SSRRLVRGLCCRFFFQAEDGIRYWSVTGVQTCALPICPQRSPARRKVADLLQEALATFRRAGDRWGLISTLWRIADLELARERGSEERRVGEECGHRRGPGRDNRQTEMVGAQQQ